MRRRHVCEGGSFVGSTNKARTGAWRLPCRAIDRELLPASPSPPPLNNLDVTDSPLGASQLLTCQIHHPVSSPFRPVFTHELTILRPGASYCLEQFLGQHERPD